jgi:hypothetical protein
MQYFKVKKGRKFFRGPKWNILGLKRSGFNVKAYFWRDCAYKLTENYGQINKLTGQSFRIFPWYDKLDNKIKPGHHKESVRFGWRCTDGNTIEILAYAYINGLRRFKSIGFTETESWIHLNFKETNSYYTFKLIDEVGNTSLVKFKKEGVKKGFLGLFINRLYPYFGGKTASPHNMTITLKYLKKFL